MTDSCLIYDAEIIRCIPPKDGQLEIDLQYCEGWHDHAGMGLACLCVWDCKDNVPLVFCQDNLDDLRALILRRDLFVGVNSIRFDNELLAANDIHVPRYKSYDLLRELWITDGLDPDNFNYKTHGGYGLDAICRVNFGVGKTGNGELAPVNWQRGKIGNVISYCLMDVFLTRRVWMRACAGTLKHPKTGEIVKLAIPEGFGR